MFLYMREVFILCRFFDDAVLMLKKGVRLCSQLQKGILVLCHGGMSFLIVEKKDFQLSRSGAMLYFFGA